MPSDHPSPAEISEDLRSIDQRYKTVIRDIELLKRDIQVFQSEQDTEENVKLLRTNIEKLQT